MRDSQFWTVRTTTNKPAARYLHAMAYDSSRGVTVLFGGNGASNKLLGDTREYGIISDQDLEIFLPLVLRSTPLPKSLTAQLAHPADSCARCATADFGAFIKPV